MKFDIITIFPEIFDSYFKESVIRRALDKKLIQIKTHNLRDFTKDKHHKVDDKPYGGGAGMVLMAEPILRAVQSLKPEKKSKIIILSAKGKQLNQKMIYDWSRKLDNLVLISGRYEGIDERVKQILRAEEVSIGPYVLTDGDVAAMAIISVITRLIPGVINWESLLEESLFNALIRKEKEAVKEQEVEYPHYTRPEIIQWHSKKYRVPKVLLEGNHKKIGEWRRGKQKASH